MNAEDHGAFAVLVSGLPGSGKSYFALRLSEELEAEYISSDRVRMRIIRKPQYTDQEKHLVYGKMLEEMVLALSGGRNVVLDATFIRKDVRQLFISRLKEMNYSWSLIRLIADEELIRRRISTKRSHSDADFEVYLRLKKEYEEIEYEHLVLNTGNTGIEELKKMALEFIRRSA